MSGVNVTLQDFRSIQIPLMLTLSARMVDTFRMFRRSPESLLCAAGFVTAWRELPTRALDQALHEIDLDVPGARCQ